MLSKTDIRNYFQANIFYYLFIIYVLIKFAILFNMPLDYVPIYDAHSYLLASTGSLFSLQFYSAAPVFYLLFLKLFHQNVTLIFIAQALISILAWWLLATLIYQKLKNKHIVFAWIFPVVLLIYTCSLKISLWDAQALTESLTISLFVFYLYFYFKLLESDFKSKPYFITTCLIMLAFLNQRTANAYFLLFCIPLFLFLFFRIKSNFAHIGLAVFVTIIVANFALITWATNKSKIWIPSMSNVLSAHLAYYPSAMDYFSAKGMPLMARQQLEIWVKDPSNQSANYGISLFNNTKTRDWLVANSRHVYSEYLITHPSYFLSPFSFNLDLPNNLAHSKDALFSPNNFIIYAYRYGAPHNMMMAHFLSRLSSFGLMSKLDIFPAIVALLFILLLVLSVKSRKLFYSASLQSTIYFFLVSIPTFLFVWHADSFEPQRHQLLTSVDIMLSLLLGFVMLLEGNQRPPEERRESEK